MAKKADDRTKKIVSPRDPELVRIDTTREAISVTLPLKKSVITLPPPVVGTNREDE